MATASRSSNLTAQHWVDAALAALAEGGLAAVSVERLARSLGATKGSFYWHFENRDALVAAALSAWEAGETVEIERMLAPLSDARSRLRVLMRAALDDRPGARVEAGLLSDARVPEVAAVLDRATRARTAYLRQLFTELGTSAPAQRATTGFALYLGLLHMRRAATSRTLHGDALDDYVEHVCRWLVTDADPQA